MNLWVGFEKRAKEILQGGKADGKPDKDFNTEQLRKGIKVESEHTPNKALQKEIAKDHLTEDPRYYDKLIKMEKGASEQDQAAAPASQESASQEPVSQEPVSQERKAPVLFGRSLKGPHKRLVNHAIRRSQQGAPVDLKLTYRKEDGSESVRRVTPLTTRKDVFVAKDHSRNGDVRSFKLHRVVSLEKHALEKHALEKHALETLASEQWIERALQRVRIRQRKYSQADLETVLKKREQGLPLTEMEAYLLEQARA